MRPPIYSSGARLGCHLSFSWRGVIIRNTVTTWSTRSLSAIGIAGMSVMGLMTTFQVFYSIAATAASLLGAGLVLVQYARGLLHDMISGTWCHPTKILDKLVITQREEHLKAQEEGRRFSVYSTSINPTLLVALLLGGYSMSASCYALFTYFASTYQKRASTIPSLDFLLVSIGTFLEGITIFPDSGQVSGSSNITAPCLHFKPLYLHSRSLTFDVVRAQEDFLFWILCTLRDFDGVMTSSQLLRLHVDRGLERHGYPWVPTDQGLGGPCQVDPTYQKPHRPASGPETLSASPVTLEHPRRPYLDPGGPVGLTT
jgi:hypothetical protein